MKPLNLNRFALGRVAGTALFASSPGAKPHGAKRYWLLALFAFGRQAKMRSMARYALSIGAGAVLAACTGLQWQPKASDALPTVVDPLNARVDVDYKVSPGLLYVALFNPGSESDKVQVYNTKVKDPRPIASITNGISEPQSACIDGDGTLYVVNGPGWISEYALGKTKPFQVITEGIAQPAFCTIDGSGNLWVTNLATPDVVEYLKGLTTPYKMITKGVTYPVGIAIDHSGNLYVANNENPVNVQVYSPNSKSPSRTITDGLVDPIDVAVDAEARLYVTNFDPPGSVQEYRAGQNHPYRAITKEMNGPSGITIDPEGRMYLTNTNTQGGSGPAPAILEFRHGSLDPSKKMITKGLAFPLGTAYYPALLP